MDANGQHGTIRTQGIHHVSCITGDAQQNLDFYVGVIGMRLVKRSVNQDSIGTYHLFYADAVGSPGTDLTFFPIPQAPAFRAGTGESVELSLAIPAGSESYWQQRLEHHGIQCGEPENRFGEWTLPWEASDGLRLTFVVAAEREEFVPWENSAVPAEFQVRGVHAVRMFVREIGPTDSLLQQFLGLVSLGVEDGWHRYGTDDGSSGSLVDVKAVPDMARGRSGVGGIHHVAWRMRDFEQLQSSHARLREVGLFPNGPIDRFWFESVYFREPGGVLFELATDGPGFSRDEPVEHLGEKLILPPWLEARRSDIEAGLPKLNVPK